MHVAERALLSIEAKQAADGQDPDDVTALVTHASNARRSRLDSYRVIIQGLQSMVALLFALAALYCLVSV